MNSDTKDCSNCSGRAASIIAILGAFLIIAGLVWAMRHYTRVPDLNANRAAERAKALAELRAAEADAIHNVGWVDPTKGVVRLRVEDAMKIVEQQWGQNPAAARKDLIARVEKATAVPPPEPAKPSEFE